MEKLLLIGTVLIVAIIALLALISEPATATAHYNSMLQVVIDKPAVLCG